MGTLHSQCFRALGTPVIAEDREHIELWNEEQNDYRMSLGRARKRICGRNIEVPDATAGSPRWRQIGP